MFAVPTFPAFDVTADLPALWLVTVFIVAIGGLLLLFSWLQNRKEPALALWGIGYLIASVGAALPALPGLVPESWSIRAGTALLCCAYGVMWAGARRFEGRQARLLWVIAGPAIWLLACQVGAIYQSAPARVAAASVILTAYTLLSAHEVWRARDRELISRWPTLALLLLHSLFLAGRGPLIAALALTTFAGRPPNTVIFVLAFEGLLTAFCLAFLRVSMAKERVELEQRRAALTDSLTGIANRRAFFDRGEALLECTLADRRPAALLLFDLDRFKDVNDTGGHQTGDRVLRVFSDLVTIAMRPDDLFARIGGEEFALLLLDQPMGEALQIAERVRREFAAMPLSGLAKHSTVSVGVAMAGKSGRGLSGLLANADRALYRAKADGRNRVATVPPVLIEAGKSARHFAMLSPSGDITAAAAAT